MSALADALRALMTPAASAHECYEPARDVLRKHARCEECNGAGWSPASVEAAIARAEDLEAGLQSSLNEWYTSKDDSVSTLAAGSSLAASVSRVLDGSPR